MIYSWMTYLFPSSSLSEAFAVILFVVVYSLLISNIFGHPSFWRWTRQHFLEYVPRGAFRGAFRRKGKKGRIETYRTLVKAPSKEKLFEFLNENVILEALYFLSAVELLTISQLSKRHYDLINEKGIWVNLSRNYFNSGLVYESEDISSKRKFFAYLKEYPFNIAKSRKGLNIIINGGIYDLSEFILDHPGGEGILNEWNGKDASKAFGLASHSKYALKLARKYLIWPKSNSEIVQEGKRNKFNTISS